VTLSSAFPGLLSISLSFSPVAPTLDHRASLKHFVSLQFLNPKTISRTFGRDISPSQGHCLHKHRTNADEYPFLEWDPNPRLQCSSSRPL
jgi:hypothetical protein